MSAVQLRRAQRKSPYSFLLCFGTSRQWNLDVIGATEAWTAGYTGARIIDLSLGGAYSSIIDAAIDYARSQGSLIIAAAGFASSSVETTAADARRVRESPPGMARIAIHYLIDHGATFKTAVFSPTKPLGKTTACTNLVVQDDKQNGNSPHR